MKPEDDEPIGDVREEAVKLLGAVQDWARDSGGRYSETAAEAATGASATVGFLSEHIAGGEECNYCPLCRGISAFRGIRPEVKTHLAAAATSLMQALASAMEAQEEGRSS